MGADRLTTIMHTIPVKLMLLPGIGLALGEFGTEVKKIRMQGYLLILTMMMTSMEVKKIGLQLHHQILGLLPILLLGLVMLLRVAVVMEEENQNAKR